MTDFMIVYANPEAPRVGGLALSQHGWSLPRSQCAIRIKLMLEWELLAVFVRPETHGSWYLAVIALVGFDVIIGVFVVAGAS